MHSKVLLITPPFTQLNTPYPATAYLKGYLNTLHIEAHQADLGIEVILALFSKQGLTDFFAKLDAMELELSENAYRIYQLQQDYIATIEPVVRFLQNKNPTLAHTICGRDYLPEASRFNDLDDLEWAFGTMGIQDQARHLATMYLEDLGDLIVESIDPHFGFSRYAERLGRTATHFDELLESLLAENSLVSQILVDLLDQKLKAFEPTVVCISVPFPGNLFSAFKCGQYIKQYYPHIKVVLGGGYANTELRRLSEPRVFDFIDYVCLDDGEMVLNTLLQYIAGKRDAQQLKRVFMRTGNEVVYHNSATEKDAPQKDCGTPDYSDLPLTEYISVIEIANPMHRLWSDGRWNKLTLAHGCYWGQCSFCDISLDYIRKYEPLTARLLCDRMESIMAQTGQNGFHFVDEAAPPVLMRELAFEIIRRRMTVTWWTNIRFEKAFTPDLSRLLKASGCIAVSGGLEVAADRLLALMKKGVTVAQVSQVADGFTRAGIMVHAYLMYGFPTQTAQETVDALEMVRQLFQAGVLQSGYWHRFAMTAHSPVGLAPADYQVEMVGPEFGGFADNDLFHEDPLGANHDLFSEGLRKSLFNYMHGAGFDMRLNDWFGFDVPRTTIPKKYIENCLNEGLPKNDKPNALVVWLGNVPEVSLFETNQKGKTVSMAEVEFHNKKKDWQLLTTAAAGEWLQKIIPKLIITHQPVMTYKELVASYETTTGQSFIAFTNSDAWKQLRENGLLVL